MELTLTVHCALGYIYVWGVFLIIQYREACFAPRGQGAGLHQFHVNSIVIVTMFWQNMKYKLDDDD